MLKQQLNYRLEAKTVASYVFRAVDIAVKSVELSKAQSQLFYMLPPEMDRCEVSL